MKPIIKETRLLGRRYSGITLYPFIFVKEGGKNDEILINHEMIHFVQQEELWVLKFYFLYLKEGLIKGYRNISFEKEAYENQYNLEYLTVREKHAWKKYLQTT